MIAVIVFLVFVAYLAIGLGVAKWELPLLWKHAKASNNYGELESMDVNTWVCAIVVLWPLAGPWAYFWNQGWKPIHTDDPTDRKERELAEREAHIATLERELGVGQQ